MQISHHALTSQTIRQVTALCKLIDQLADEEPDRAARMLKTFKSTLQTAHRKLAEITPPPAPYRPLRRTFTTKPDTIRRVQ